MKPEFHTQYRPLTSRPFLKGDLYAEYIPCELLSPYISCFWESYSGGKPKNRMALSQEVLVIPDTCMDIIVEINYTNQTIKSRLCGLADSSTLIKQKQIEEAVITFGVRFYFWSAYLFLDIEMKEMYNQVFDFERIDPEWNREFEAFFYMKNTRERISWMENCLLKRLQKNGRK